MSATAWERRKAVADRLFAAWDCRRTAAASTWPGAFAEAKAVTLARMQADLEIARGIDFEEFARLNKLPAAGAVA